ncbi:MAG: PEPxxWA-CTERM sorting domain-containing protein [Pontixanthobacter sp.]
MVMVSFGFIKTLPAKIAEHRKLAVSLGVAAPMAVLAVSLSQVPESTHSGANNPLHGFLVRSPGERGAVLPIKGKAARAAGGSGNVGPGAPGGGGPRQRALGKIFETPPEEAVGLPAGNGPMGDGELNDPVGGVIPIGGIADAEPLPLAPGDAGGGTGGGIPGSPGVIGGGGFIGGGGGGGSSGGGGDGSSGGGGSGGGGGGTPPVDVVAPVPEPATWLMMIFGFGLIGGLMRRRDRSLERKPLSTK